MIFAVASIALAPTASLAAEPVNKQAEQPARTTLSRPGERFNIGTPVRSIDVNLDQLRESAKQPAVSPKTQPSLEPSSPPPPKTHIDNHFPERHHGHGRGGFGFQSPGFIQFGSTIGVSYSPGYYYSQPITRPIAGQYSPIDPNLVVYPPVDKNASPPEPPTADELLSQRNYRDAGSLFRAALKVKPDDLETQRLLAVALAGEGKFAAAAALMERVYEVAPEISGDPLDGRTLFGPGRELRRLVVRAVRHAHRTQDAQSWLLVAVLIQSEGRDRIAKKMINRAMMAGLDGQIIVAWPDQSI